MHDITKAGKADHRTPFLCARYQDYALWFEGMGWDLPRTDAMMAGRENTRYADICGEDIAAMEGLGWEFTDEPVCFTATCGCSALVFASAWAAPMRTEDKQAGCNLSYAVDAGHEGRALATLLSCLAFLACDQQHRGLRFANIESRADNLASLALARSLGFAPYPEGDFTMPVAGRADEVPFHCLRAEPEALRLRAHRILQDKGLGRLSALIPPVRPRRGR